MENTIDVSRFRAAHERYFNIAIWEIKNGRKLSHWMWFIFPQLRDLGESETAYFYGLENMAEAAAFLHDEYLGGNLLEISNALLSLEINNPVRVFGPTDAKKLRSCMTLFAHVPDTNPVFGKVLEKYYDGVEDKATLELLGMR